MIFAWCVPSRKREANSLLWETQTYVRSSPPEDAFLFESNSNSLLRNNGTLLSTVHWNWKKSSIVARRSSCQRDGVVDETRNKTKLFPTITPARDHNDDDLMVIGRAWKWPRSCRHTFAEYDLHVKQGFYDSFDKTIRPLGFDKWRYYTLNGRREAQQTKIHFRLFSGPSAAAELREC